jgi:hypothetical protein
VIAETDDPWLRLRDLARELKAAVESGKLEEAAFLAGRRGDLLRDIQKIDASAGVRKPAVPEDMIREIMALDEEAVRALKAGMREVSGKLEKINTFKVLCQGAIDGARTRGGATAP